MYEIYVLGCLSRRPMHGYMIHKILGTMMGPFKQVGWGALYPVLNRLEADGLIQVCEQASDEEGGSRRSYAITEAGCRRLHELLMDTEHHLADYQTLFAYKVGLFSLLIPSERVQIARHYAVYAQQHIDHLSRKAEEMKVSPPVTDEQAAWIIEVMKHRIESWRLELLWAEQLLRQATDDAVTLTAQEIR